MYELLKANINSRVKITDAEFEKIAARAKPLHLKKKQFLLKAGEICRYDAFIEKGLIRSYTIDEKGVEHVTQLALEDHWVGDLYSLITNQPTELYIEALEDCELVLLSAEAMEKLYVEVPVLERMFRLLIQSAYVATLKRLNATLRVSAEERYVELIKKHPDMIQRIPLIHIASYLGITPESLSRIRKHLAKKHHPIS